jgi:hypothetical protein
MACAKKTKVNTSQKSLFEHQFFLSLDTPHKILVFMKCISEHMGCEDVDTTCFLKYFEIFRMCLKCILNKGSIYRPASQNIAHMNDMKSYMFVFLIL